MSKLNSSVFGDGEIPIVLVHGWAASGRMWEGIHPHFKNAKFFAPDFAGFGKTPSPEKPPTIADHVASLIEFCDEVKPQILIAHSMGGLVTLKALVQRPDLAQELVLISPVVTGKFGINGIGSQLVTNPVGQAALRASETLWPTIQKEYLVKMALDPFDSFPELTKRMKQDFLDSNPKAAIEAMIGITQENLEPRLAEITLPTLIFVGEQDGTVPASEGKTAARLMPNARLVTFDKGRHHPMDELSAEFLPALKTFLGNYGIK